MLLFPWYAKPLQDTISNHVELGDSRKYLYHAIDSFHILIPLQLPLEFSKCPHDLKNLIIINPLSIGRMEKPESGIRNRSRKRNRNRNRNRNPNPNLRNKLGDVSVLRVSLTIIAWSRLLIPTLYLFIVIIFCTVGFFAYGAKFFFENFIYTWALQLGIMIDWHEYSSSLCRLFLTMVETRSPFKKLVT